MLEFMQNQNSYLWPRSTFKTNLKNDQNVDCQSHKKANI